MKKLFFGIIAAAVVITGIFTFAGCEKEEKELNQTTTLKIEKATTDVNNPYSFVGELHNQGLDYIISHANKDALFNEETCIEEIRNNMLDFMNSINWPIPLNLDYSMITTSIMDEDFSMESLGLTPEELRQWNSLENNIFEHLTTSELSQRLEYAHEFNDFVSNIPDENKRTILYIASAVLLSSSSYWCHELELGIESEWFSELNDDGVCYAVLSTEQKEAILEADAWGAGLGSIAGAAKGATAGTMVLPGVGSLTGAIAGMLLGGLDGGISSSVSRATYEAGKSIKHHVKRRN